MQSSAPEQATYLCEFAWNQHQLNLIADALINEEYRLHRLSNAASHLCDTDVYDSLAEKRQQLETVARKLLSYADELGHR